MGSSFWQSGLRIGTFKGITVRLHWVLLAWWLLSYTMFVEADLGSGSSTLFAWALSTFLSFSIILLHEFGHCFAARYVGGQAHDVLLWPLGGLAMINVPSRPRAHFIATAGGPAVNVVIAIIAFPLFRLLEAGRPELLGNLFYWAVKWVLIEWNLILLVFNLLPIYPMDGGRIFHALAWAQQEKRHGAFREGPYYRASIVTVWVSRVTAVLGIISVLLGWLEPITGRHSLFAILIFAWVLYETERFRKSLRYGSGFAAGNDQGFMGYDFSEGYTSLEKSRPKETGKRAKKKKAKTPDEREEMDALLDRISQHGMHSLSAKERARLEKLSRKV